MIFGYLHAHRIRVVCGLPAKLTMSIRQLAFICNLKHSTLIVLTIVCEILTSEVPRPRGVSLSRASLYDPERDFLCFDGTATIPFVQVNDDYCDCPDGSDEPGTAACYNGVFHCTNAGHKPLNIHSSRVNDGICDCCDGSDEYAGGKAACASNCYELGRTAREEAQRQAELVKIGNQVRLEYSQKGIQLKQEKKEKLSELQKHKAEAELVLKEKEALKKEAEELEGVALEQYRRIEEQEQKRKEEAEAADTRAEAIETFNKFDSNQDGKVDISELQTRQTFDKDRNGEVSIEEAKFFLNEQESVDLEEFISVAWPRIKPFMMLDAGLFKPPASDGDEEEEEVHEGEAEELTEEELNEGEGHELEGEEEEDEELEEKPAEPTTPPPPPKYDDETQKLVDVATEARKEYDSAKQSVGDIQAEVTNIEEYLEKDYGPDEEFAVLEGQCFEYSDHEYIYKLCPFDKTVQQPKSNSLETRLGTWSQWSGSEINKYQVMMYERGQSCWNGPQRTTKVLVNCGSENKVVAVTEPNRCEYQFDFITPAACKEFSSDNGDDLHDEL